jgi:hypothetical protein
LSNEAQLLGKSPFAEISKCDIQNIAGAPKALSQAWIAKGLA